VSSKYGTPWLWIAGAGALGWLLYSQRSTVARVYASGVEDVTAAVTGWKEVNTGPAWVPFINSVETQYGIPPDLLARVAYQESRFRPDVISGDTPGGAGELGIMQMMPQYFTSVNVPRPYTVGDVEAQIREAAGLLSRLMDRFNDWGLAVAAYNDGASNVDKYLGNTRALSDSTIEYVSAVLADVPLSGATIPG